MWSAYFFLLVICSCKQEKKRSNADISGLSQKGAGVIAFDAYEPLKDKPVNIWFYTPVDNPVDLPILFVYHGNNRNADDYRDNWIELANKQRYNCSTGVF